MPAQDAVVARRETSRRTVALLALLAVTPSALAQPAQRTAIGQVLGKPVYRDEIRMGPGFTVADELRRLFLAPVEKQYRTQNRKETEMTQEQLDAAAKHFHKQEAERLAGPEGASIRAEVRKSIAAVEAKLADPTMDKRQRAGLLEEKQIYERQLVNDIDRFRIMVAVFVPQQYFGRHLHLNYGGGRVLVTKFGTYAFDAQRRWVEEREKQGDFRIDDAELRRQLFTMWEQYDATPRRGTSFVSAAPEHVRLLTEPGWLPPAKP